MCYMSGETALLYAARNGQLETTQFLLERGADLHRQTRSGETALDVAVAQQETAIIDVLRAAGAELTPNRSHDQTLGQAASAAGLWSEADEDTTVNEAFQIR